MRNAAEYVLYAIVIGVGATLLTDAWAWIRKRLAGSASLDYALVGRWLVHLAHGRFRHESIGATP
ncbi:MAG TPA: DUF2938 family protein, partial [Rhodanobacteraceae bacterium]|nr:DUF2938 family protein [Rhodanobacteraceae bacterium]